MTRIVYCLLRGSFDLPSLAYNTYQLCMILLFVGMILPLLRTNIYSYKAKLFLYEKWRSIFW